jgi:hypothetical protein
MANKGFKGFLNAAGQNLVDIDKVVGTTIANGQRAAAERIVRELQQVGPSWSGEFSNSWQISTASSTYKGTGAPGEPRPIRAPVVTGREAVAGQIFKDPLLTITNFAPHALEAIDAVEHDRQYYARRKTAEPTTSLGQSKWKVEGPRSNVSARGATGGGTEGSNSSRTAPLDWFATYASSKLNRAVKIEMDSAFQRRFG